MGAAVLEGWKGARAAVGAADARGGRLDEVVAGRGRAGVRAVNRAEQRRVHAQAAWNQAEWHASCTAALGFASTVERGWWTCPLPAPNIYFSAISVEAARTRRDRARLVAAIEHRLTDPAAALVSVCDSWDQLDLRGSGLQRRSAGQWFARPAGECGDGGDVGGLRIAAVTDADGLARFEQTMVAGFGARPPVAPFDIHAPAILDDPAMHVLGGWVEGQLVSCAMTYVTDVAGIYGVATLPRFRRRGYAAAMTAAAVNVDPDRVAVLQPTRDAARLYRRLGFTPVGAFSHWA